MSVTALLRKKHIKQPGTVIAHPIQEIRVVLHSVPKKAFKSQTMKKIYIGFLLVTVSLMTMAQGNNTPPASNDPAAKAILDQVNAKFKSFKTVQAGFVYKFGINPFVFRIFCCLF